MNIFDLFIAYIQLLSHVFPYAVVFCLGYFFCDHQSKKQSRQSKRHAVDAYVAQFPAVSRREAKKLITSDPIQ